MRSALRKIPKTVTLVSEECAGGGSDVVVHELGIGMGKLKITTKFG
jgi:hypothetical protein